MTEIAAPVVAGLAKADEPTRKRIEAAVLDIGARDIARRQTVPGMVGLHDRGTQMELLGSCADLDRAGRDLEADVAVARRTGRAYVGVARGAVASKAVSIDRRPPRSARRPRPRARGFSPTPEFPEIEEAQTFLTALPKPTK